MSTSFDLFDHATDLYRSGDLGTAAALLSSLLHGDPDRPDAWFLLGSMCHHEGRLTEAEVCYRQVIQLRPDSAEAHNNLGAVQEEQGGDGFVRAAACYRDELQLRGNYQAASTNLARVLVVRGLQLEEQGRLDEAFEHYREAELLDSGNAALLTNLGNVLRKRGRFEEARRYYEKAILFEPNSVPAHNNLGIVLHSLGNLDGAIVHFRHAARLKADDAESLGNLGSLYKDRGELDTALDCYRSAVALAPDDAALHSNLLLAMHYHPQYDAEALFVAHRLWAERFTAPLDVSESVSDRSLRKRLRLGYVSADMRQHVMGLYLEAVLGEHDRNDFEVICYANVAQPDALTARLQKAANQWRSIVGLSDADAAELIRQDGIDVLIDLNGHTGGHRLLMFAHKPAPVQVTHFGYPQTTGLLAMNYRLTDAWCDPPGMTEHFHTEQLVRLPEISWCYRPPPDCPDVGKLPSLTAPLITFGSLNNLAKITPEVIDLWSQIMTQLAGSRLILLTSGSREGDRRLIEAFVGKGIAAGRVQLAQRKQRTDYLLLYREIDIALDPFPYTGCNTTCDALWMGVPVITLTGMTCVSRQSLSVLCHLGLTDWIASTASEYGSIAIGLAAGRDRLQHIRATLRDHMSRSTLLDARRFTRYLEDAYRWMWERTTGKTQFRIDGM